MTMSVWSTYAGFLMAVQVYHRIFYLQLLWDADHGPYAQQFAHLRITAVARCLLVDGEQRILKVKEAGTRSRLIGIRVKSELVIQ